MITSKIDLFLIAGLFCIFPLSARNIFLEFKGAYFLPVDKIFKAIYPHGGALYGPELTVQLRHESRWHAFASFDYFKKSGNSIGLCSPTTVTLVPLTVGLKYFMPQYRRCIDFYAGIGFEAMHIRTKNYSEYYASNISKWGFGAIAKAGIYYHLPHSFLIDIFIDYSFINVGSNGSDYNAHGLRPRKAHVGGAIFGAALGYAF